MFLFVPVKYFHYSIQIQIVTLNNTLFVSLTLFLFAYFFEWWTVNLVLCVLECD